MKRIYLLYAKVEGGKADLIEAVTIGNEEQLQPAQAQMSETIGDDYLAFSEWEGEDHED